jgi:2-phosphoglycerate kinase
VLEGIHMHPALQSTIIHRRDSIIVPITLAVLKRDQLRSQIRGRANEAPSRRAERYLQEFDNIWQLQSFLLNEADRCDVSIINNNSMEKAAVQVLDTVIGVLSNFFAGNPDVIFDTE